MTQSFLVFVDGPMGSGKTTTTKLLNSELPNTARIAFPDIKRLIPNYGENAKTIPIIKEVMAVMIDKYLEHGVSVIVEQITKKEGIQLLKDIADKHQAKFFAYRMNAPKDVRWERVKERTRLMMEVEKLPESKVEELRGYFDPNNEFYESNPSDLSVQIDSFTNNPELVVEIIKKEFE
jgi:predicted ABC-type ATPase